MHNRAIKIVYIVGFIALIIGCAMIPTIDIFIHKEVLKNVRLTDGPDGPTESYKMWKEPTVPIYMQFYVFDLANPNEVIAGAKPYLMQKGPFTYREHRRKVNIMHNPNGTVTYMELKSYDFVPSMSVADDSETFTTVNIPLLTLVESLRYETDSFQDMVSVALALFGEDIFRRLTVHQLVWGYHDQLLKAGKELFPTWIYTDFIGVFTDKNNTEDGVYTIYTGENDPHRLGVIDKFNGSSYLPYWSDQYANMINGSDGTLGPPFLNKSMVLYTFVSDICRSVPGVYDADEETPQGIKIWRFVGPDWGLASASVNPNNKGFCTPPGNCLGSGVVNVTTCKLVDNFHIPTVISLPHFYMADKKYLEAVQGLNPIAEEHRTEIGMEPITGLALKVAKRLQINIYIESFKHVEQTHNLTSVVFPVLWLNESATIDDETAALLKGMLFIPMFVAVLVQCILIGVGGYVVVVISLYCMVRKCHPKRRAHCSVAYKNGAIPSGIQGYADEHTRLIQGEADERTRLIQGEAPGSGI